MLDRIFRIFGLHGCSVMPFIVGGGIAGGCAVPGVLAARTLRSPREKIATLLTVPFMACGAKLPVFILFPASSSPVMRRAVMFGLTLTGWVVALAHGAAAALDDYPWAVHAVRHGASALSPAHQCSGWRFIRASARSSI